MNKIGLDAWLAGQRERILPLSLPLSDGNALQGDAVLRLLPGKRLVLRAHWQGRAVLAKLFVADAGLDRQLQRELRGVQALQAAGMDTPALRWQGMTACGCAGVLLFDFLENARSLGAVWVQADAAGQDVLRRALARNMARLHAAGLYQADAHFDNFLLQQERLWLIDAASVVQGGAPLPCDLAQANLALLLAQWPLQQALQEQPQLLRHYAEAGGCVEAALSVRRRLQRQWTQRLRKLLRKTLRDCTPFRVQSTRTTFSSLKREHDTAEWQAFLADPDAVMAGGQVLKDGNSATVVQTVLGGTPVVIKRYNIKSRWHFLRHALRRSRARRAWLGGFLLAEAGVPTPEPLALLEHRRCGLLTRAWLVTAYRGGEPLDQKQLETHASVVPQVVTIREALAAARISHGDMKASNFLVHEDGALSLIDLDALRWHRSTVTARRALARDWRRFLRNWAKSPDTHAAFEQAASESAVA